MLSNIRYVKYIREVVKERGLTLNVDKTKVMVFNK